MRLEIESIQKSFKGKMLLNDVSLHCETGEIIGILGRNGSGKSTLFKIAFGVMRAESSFVRIGEQVMQTQFQRAEKLSYLPQNSFLPRNIKIKDAIPLFCSGENIQALHSHSFLTNFLNSVPKELSAGELRLIEIMLILYSDSKFAILDEPFHSLSPKIIQELQSIIKYKSSEKGIIISDHSYQDVLEISHKIYLLSNGALRNITSNGELQFSKYLK